MSSIGRCLFIDRSICHGRYRHRPSILLRENTVDIDLDRRSTYGRYRHRPSIHLRENTVNRWSSIKYRDNFFSVTHFCLPWPPSSALQQTSHKKENNRDTQQQRQWWTNSQEFLKEKLMVQNCSVNIRFLYPPPRWPPASQLSPMISYGDCQAHIQLATSAVFVWRFNAAFWARPRFSEMSKKDHWPMVPNVVRNGPGHPSTKKSWSHEW